MLPGVPPGACLVVRGEAAFAKGVGAGGHVVALPQNPERSFGFRVGRAKHHYDLRRCAVVRVAVEHGEADGVATNPALPCVGEGAGGHVHVGSLDGIRWTAPGEESRLGHGEQRKLLRGHFEGTSVQVSREVHGSKLG